MTDKARDEAYQIAADDIYPGAKRIASGHVTAWYEGFAAAWDHLWPQIDQLEADLKHNDQDTQALESHIRVQHAELQRKDERITTLVIQAADKDECLKAAIELLDDTPPSVSDCINGVIAMLQAALKERESIEYTPEEQQEMYLRAQALKEEHG